MARDKINLFYPDDPDMNAAIRKARETIQQFIDAFCYPAKNQRSFLLKAAFESETINEHIWMADLLFLGERFQGVVANESRLPGLKFMQITEFSPLQVTDWMYVEDGYLIGGYTTKLIRERMGLEERRQYDADAPYKFR